MLIVVLLTFFTAAKNQTENNAAFSCAMTYLQYILFPVALT